MTGISIDPVHGVNPSVYHCFYCHGEMGVALFGHMKGEMRGEKAPRSVIIDRVPCDTCADYMKKGIIFIEVEEEKSADEGRPLHVGGFAVITEEGVKKMLQGDVLEDVLKRRVAFVATSVWKELGL